MHPAGLGAPALDPVGQHSVECEAHAEELSSVIISRISMMFDWCSIAEASVGVVVGRSPCIGCTCRVSVSGKRSEAAWHRLTLALHGVQDDAAAAEPRPKRSRAGLLPPMERRRSPRKTGLSPCTAVAVWEKTRSFLAHASERTGQEPQPPQTCSYGQHRTGPAR